MADFKDYINKATDWMVENPAWTAAGTGLTAGTLAALLSQRGNKFRNFLIGLATGGGGAYLGLKGYGSYRDWKNKQKAQGSQIPDNPEATPGTGRQGSEGNDDPQERYMRNVDAQKATENYMKAYNAKKYKPTEADIRNYLKGDDAAYTELFNNGYDPDTPEGQTRLEVLKDAAEAYRQQVAKTDSGTGSAATSEAGLEGEYEPPTPSIPFDGIQYRGYDSRYWKRPFTH